jgi:hypothetical protein
VCESGEGCVPVCEYVNMCGNIFTFDWLVGPGWLGFGIDRKDVLLSYIVKQRP